MLHGNNKQITIPTEQWLQNTFDSNSWVILSAIEQSIKAKIEKYGTPLKDWDVQINYGIKTGCNEAFIITTAKREEILANCKTKDERKRTDEIIRPILRGRDIKRYKYDWKGLWLIGLFPSRHYDIDTLPAIKKYLLDFGFDRLKQTGEKGARKKTSNKWFETQDTIAYWEDFSKPKIMFQEMVQEPQFFLDSTDNFMCLDTGRIIVGSNLLWLLDILNSKLFFYAIKHYYGGGALGNNGVRMKHSFFINFPCALPPSRGIMKDSDKEQYIFDLYHLTNQEIAWINEH